MEFGAIALPLMAATGYALASLVLKRAMALGGGVLVLMVLGNLLTTLCFALILGLEGLLMAAEGVAWAVLGGLGFLAGQVFSVWAVKSGEVSVQTPLMGAKTVIVAVLSVGLGIESLGWMGWLSVMVSMLAVFLIAGGTLAAIRNHIKTLFIVIGACVGFGVTDIVVAAQAKVYGTQSFIMLVVLVAGGLSPLFLLFRDKRQKLSLGSWRMAVFGGLLIAMQALGMNLAIGYYEQPTVTNVIYSSRGVIGVGLVWLIGNWFTNVEIITTPPSIMRKRLIGSVLILLAVALAMMK